MAGRLKHRYRLNKTIEYAVKHSDNDGLFNVKSAVDYCNTCGNRFAATNANQLANLLRGHPDFKATGTPWVWEYLGEK